MEKTRDQTRRTLNFRRKKSESKEEWCAWDLIICIHFLFVWREREWESVCVHDYPLIVRICSLITIFRIYIGFDWISRERAELKHQSLVNVANGLYLILYSSHSFSWNIYIVVTSLLLFLPIDSPMNVCCVMFFF